MSNICTPGGHDIGHGHDIWRAEEGDAGSNGGKREGVHEVKMSNQALLEIFEGLSNEPMVTWPSVFCQQVCIFIKISEIKCTLPYMSRTVWPQPEKKEDEDEYELSHHRIKPFSLYKHRLWKEETAWEMCYLFQKFAVFNFCSVIAICHTYNM